MLSTCVCIVRVEHMWCRMPLHCESLLCPPTYYSTQWKMCLLLAYAVQRPAFPVPPCLAFLDSRSLMRQSLTVMWYPVESWTSIMCFQQNEWHGCGVSWATVSLPNAKSVDRIYQQSMSLLYRWQSCSLLTVFPFIAGHCCLYCYRSVRARIISALHSQNECRPLLLYFKS